MYEAAARPDQRNRGGRGKARASRSSSVSSSDSALSADPRSVSSSSESNRASRSTSPKREKKLKYDRKLQVKKGDSLKNAVSLRVYLIKLLRSSHKKRKHVRGLIDHLLVMAEKVESGYYKMECLTGYDDQCREKASEKGIRSFGEIRPAAVLRFLSYDSTTNARHQQSVIPG